MKATKLKFESLFKAKSPKDAKKHFVMLNNIYESYASWDENDSGHLLLRSLRDLAATEAGEPLLSEIEDD